MCYYKNQFGTKINNQKFKGTKFLTPDANILIILTFIQSSPIINALSAIGSEIVNYYLNIVKYK